MTYSEAMEEPAVMTMQPDGEPVLMGRKAKEDPEVTYAKNLGLSALFVVSVILTLSIYFGAQSRVEPNPAALTPMTKEAVDHE